MNERARLISNFVVVPAAFFLIQIFDVQKLNPTSDLAVVMMRHDPGDGPRIVVEVLDPRIVVRREDVVRVDTSDVILCAFFDIDIFPMVSESLIIFPTYCHL